VKKLIPALLVLAAAAYFLPGRFQRLSAGDRAPAFWAAPPGQVVLGWTFRGTDLLRCESEADELRRVQARWGGRIRVVAVAVGVDGTIAASFFRSERLRGDLRVLDEREYRRRFGDAPLPRLYLVREGRVVDVIDPPKAPATVEASWLGTRVHRSLLD
jgi:hypothetical protein